jgi:hypothetical protein
MSEKYGQDQPWHVTREPNVEPSYEDLTDRIEELEASLSKSEARKNAEITRLRTELEWYGEQARLCRLIHSEGDKGRHALSADGGNRARAALAELKRETGDE